MEWKDVTFLLRTCVCVEPLRVRLLWLGAGWTPPQGRMFAGWLHYGLSGSPLLQGGGLGSTKSQRWRGEGADYTIWALTHLQQSPDSEKGDMGSVLSEEGDGQQSRSLSSSM